MRMVEKVGQEYRLENVEAEYARGSANSVFRVGRGEGEGREKREDLGFDLGLIVVGLVEYLL